MDKNKLMTGNEMFEKWKNHDEPFGTRDIYVNLYIEVGELDDVSTRIIPETEDECVECLRYLAALYVYEELLSRIDTNDNLDVHMKEDMINQINNYSVDDILGISESRVNKLHDEVFREQYA